MERRRFLTVSGSSLLFGLAGCVSGDSEETEEFEGDVTLSPTGMRATVASSDRDWEQIQKTIAEELDVAPTDVRTRPDEKTIEVLVDVSESSFTAALDATNLDVKSTEQGVTAATREKAVSVLTDRLERAGIENASVKQLETGAIGIDLPDQTVKENEWVYERGAVRLVAGYPAQTESGTELRTEPVLTHEDFANVGSAQRGGARAPQVPVTLTDEAATEFVETMQEAGFTSEGIGKCSFDPEEHDGPREGEYCLYTVVDREYVYGASMSRNLAQTIESGKFEADPRFVLTATDMDRAEQLEQYLKGEPLPVEVDVNK